MTVRSLFGAIALCALAFCSTASASVSRTVESGESLWSIAGANGISVAELAAANGLGLRTTSSRARR